LLPSVEKNRVVARRIGAVAADGEHGFDGKPLSCFEPRFVEATQFRQGDGEVEMRGRKIPVGLDRTAQFSDRFSETRLWVLASRAIEALGDQGLIDDFGRRFKADEARRYSALK
jgi:hypothetical protein